jgi:uncharacterized protein (DUF305 family)
MDTKIIVVAIVALAIGAGGGYLWSGCKNHSDSAEHMMDDGTIMHDHSRDMDSAMDQMSMGLAGKSGDEFDQAFISEMITHHEGAIDMANAALVNAEHDEIKVMAEAIISAQTNEIRQMQDWQAAWYGY